VLHSAAEGVVLKGLEYVEETFFLPIPN